MILFSVLVNKEGKISDIFESTAIDVYVKEGSWKILKHEKLEYACPQTPQMVKQFSEELVSKLKNLDCNMLIGACISGVPYYILDKNQIIMCEAKEQKESVLNAIYKDFYEKEEIVSNEEQAPKKPFMIDDAGTYYFDCIKSLQANPELTTKKVLIPFLEEELFITLILKTSHMIPWLDQYLPKRHLTMHSEYVNSAYLIRIEHQICQEEMGETRCKV